MRSRQGTAPLEARDPRIAALETRQGANQRPGERERIIQFGKDRAKEGAGPITIGMDTGYVKLIVSHAAAVHGMPINVGPIDLSRVALKRPGLVGKSRERDRRPTPDEIKRVVTYFDNDWRQLIPVGRIVRFAIATAMRQEELTRIRWADIAPVNLTVVVHDRKDPRQKAGNDHRVPLLDATGVDAWKIIQEQRPHSSHGALIFPYNGRSVGTAFRRACRELKIHDLRFQDLCHEAASRLFEAGFTIEQVTLAADHKD